MVFCNLLRKRTPTNRMMTWLIKCLIIHEYTINKVLWDIERLIILWLQENIYFVCVSFFLSWYIGIYYRKWTQQQNQFSCWIEWNHKDMLHFFGTCTLEYREYYLEKTSKIKSKKVLFISPAFESTQYIHCYW